MTLETVGVTRVVDVRRLRGSERYPQFDAGRLRETLGDVGVELTASPALTGRRPIDHGVDPAVNGWWENRSFHNYADHALSVEFAAALRLLLDAGAAAPTAVMCSEAVWWRCHRRIIADHLIALGYRWCT
nr:DUF488 domain-containing protein [Tessaracoccus coleopterorum]